MEEALNLSSDRLLDDNKHTFPYPYFFLALSRFDVLAAVLLGVSSLVACDAELLGE